MKIRTIAALALFAVASSCSTEPVAAKATIVKLSNNPVTETEQEAIDRIYHSCFKQDAPCLEHAIYYSELPNRVEFQVVTA